MLELLDIGLIVGAESRFGSNLASLVKSIIGPLFLLGVGIVAMTFLIRRQMGQFFGFILIAVVIAAILYVPDMIKGLGTGLGGGVKWE